MSLVWLPWAESLQRKVTRPSCFSNDLTLRGYRQRDAHALLPRLNTSWKYFAARFLTAPAVRRNFEPRKY
jgi:hypothetical protein